MTFLKSSVSYVPDVLSDIEPENKEDEEAEEKKIVDILPGPVLY